MTMARISRPIAGRNHSLADIKMLAVKSFIENNLAGTRPIILAESYMAGIFRLDQRRLGGIPCDRRTVVGQLDIGKRLDRILNATRKIQTMGLSSKRTFAPIRYLKRPAFPRRCEIAADQHESDFTFPGIPFV